MEAEVEDTFFDECNLIHKALSYDSTYGSPVYTQTVASGVACGFDNGNSSDITKQNLFQMKVDAILSLPMDTTISGVDQIVMTKKNLVAIPNETYKISGEVQIGTTCLILNLKKVE